MFNLKIEISQNIVDKIIQFANLTNIELNEYANKIKEHIERNMFSSLDYEGNKLSPHSEAWARYKGHHKNLFWEGVLYRSISTRDIPHGKEIFVLPLTGDKSKKPRDVVAYWLQERWPFWGILPERADSILQEVLNNGFRF